MILYTLYGNSYIDIKNLKDRKGINVYINLTNKCPCACTFCLRQTKEMLEANSLWLKKEPTAEEVINELKLYDLNDFNEMIFCGFGEPIERLETVVEVAKYIKSISSIPTRMNTNGLGNLIYHQDITDQLSGLINTLSISLNAPTKEEFLELTRSRFGIQSFDAMLEFARLSKQHVDHVVLTVVDIIGEEKIKQCQQICDDLGVSLRVRPYEE